MSKKEVIEIKWVDFTKAKPDNHCNLAIQKKNGKVLIDEFYYPVINERSYLKFKGTEVDISDIAYWTYINIQGIK